jgi:hypothetical protein
MQIKFDWYLQNHPADDCEILNKRNINTIPLKGMGKRVID